MTPEHMVESLRRVGYDAETAATRAGWLARVGEAFDRVTGAPPEWRWCVPGRIEIFGKHTDYAGGRSLLAAVPRGFAVAAGARNDNRVRVLDARYGESIIIDIHDTQAKWRGWANYAAVTVRRFERNFPGATLGTDIAIASDLPRAAGLSSSSAFVVSIALALIRRAGLEARDDWRAAITSVEDLAWYLGCVENGLSFQSLGGIDGVGTRGGSQDHTAILACRPGVVSHYSFMPVRAHGETAMPAGWRFVVASSGVHADKAGSVRDRYNRASQAVERLLAIWNASVESASSSLAAALGSDPDAEARLRDVLRNRPASRVQGPEFKGPEFSTEDLDRRLSMFVRETARVPMAAAAFASADRDGLGSLTRSSQEDAERLLGNQIPETIALARLAYEQGAFAASAFGAGFGGSVWALVPAADAERFGAEWMRRYREAFPFRDTAEWFSASPGPGASAIE
ncbi:MAG TPA: galactokinase family protein [Vicinamibacterales bacterium]|nr:galactokinase family protein [Vicinamibacterales bacterium]